MFTQIVNDIKILTTINHRLNNPVQSDIKSTIIYFSNIWPFSIITWIRTVFYSVIYCQKCRLGCFQVDWCYAWWLYGMCTIQFNRSQSTAILEVSHTEQKKAFYECLIRKWTINLTFPMHSTRVVQCHRL